MKAYHFDFRITEIKHGWIFAQANILGHTIDLAYGENWQISSPEHL